MRLLYTTSLLLLFACAGNGQNANTVFRAKIGYAGQTLANVWGYTAPDGREYALAGGSKGLIIVDVTNPDQPNEIVQIPGPNSLWKEIKTYNHYCYVVSEGGQGIQVVDLSALPSANLPSKFYTGDGPITGQLNRIHALHIDTAKGYLYAYGGNLFSGGAKVFDLHTDPWNPTYVGKFDQLGYIHDGYVDNDIMYSGHIYAGQFAVVDMTDKGNPLLISTQNTPGNFTHNTWLTDDRRVLLTTDEVNNSVLAAYDVTDPTDIQLLDRVQSNPGSGSVVHNTQILGNFAVTSWYKDGFTIVDITRPDNLVQVGNYDTYPGVGGGGFDGCWGVYPYFPSGTIVATNISAPGANNNGELYIVTPDYQRACYLEGKVIDAATGFPIQNAQVEILNVPVSNKQNADLLGVYKMGQLESGAFTVRISKTGYQSQEWPVQMQNGEVTVLDVTLFPEGSLTVTGQVLSGSKNQPYKSAVVHLYGRDHIYSAAAGAQGQFVFSGVAPGFYDLTGSSFTGASSITHNIKIISDTTLMLYLYPEPRRPGHGVESLLGSIEVTPSPARAVFQVRFDLPETDGVLTVLDAYGKTVYTTRVPRGQGSLTLGEALPAGNYFMRLEAGGKLLQSIAATKLP